MFIGLFCFFFLLWMREHWIYLDKQPITINIIIINIINNSITMQSPAVSKSFSSLDETRFVFSDESVTCPNKLHQHLSGGCVSSYSSSPAYRKKHHHHHHHHSPYDYTMKVILLGDQGVGKTSFMKALHVHPDVAKVPCRCGKGGDGGGGGGGRKQQGNVDHLELEITTQTGKTALVRLCDTGGEYHIIYWMNEWMKAFALPPSILRQCEVSVLAMFLYV